MNRTRKKANRVFALDLGGCGKKSIAHYKDAPCEPYMETQITEVSASSSLDTNCIIKSNNYKSLMRQ